MKHKKMILLVSSALTIAFASGCGSSIEEVSGRNSVEDSKEVLTTFKTYVKAEEVNHEIHVVYKVENISNEEQILTFSSELYADLIIYDVNGQKVYQHSVENPTVTQGEKEVVIKSKDLIEKEFILPSLPKGKYVTEAFLTTKEEHGKVMMDLIVEKSIFKGNGKLVGVIDSRSVKIDSNGIFSTFQLTDEAFSQLQQFIPDGSEIEYLYTETENNQKVIHKFITDQPIKVQLDKSLLILEDKLVHIFEIFKENKEKKPVLLANLQPFDVFKLYMYTQAGQDFETLYYYHDLNKDSISIDQYVAESKNVANVKNIDTFMRKLGKVREFTINHVSPNRTNIEFIQDGEILQFKLEKDNNNVWCVMWMPFQ
ncbi:BsuPI-related putative proteinase inhibitor [Bacillus pinisoli]|uniref:BsuPI-related putative proteinase inhibitor n=1 Tax=Bacillus pinisoli TaxID=2901866 RepID=UPI001FF27EF6|nr:BsuPI-related putative proteinase inhibitor [Bacillus pinisoli]